VNKKSPNLVRGANVLRADLGRFGVHVPTADALFFHSEAFFDHLAPDSVLLTASNTSASDMIFNHDDTPPVDLVLTLDKTLGRCSSVNLSKQLHTRLTPLNSARLCLFGLQVDWHTTALTLVYSSFF